MPKFFHNLSREEWLDLRRRDVTSTDAAALFNLSPYSTPWQLYQQKIGALSDEIDPNERMDLGKKLEPIIASAAAERLGLKIRSVNGYARHSNEPRMGSSFDYEIVGHDRGPGMMEVKNVDWMIWRDQWTTEEAPPHIEIQHQHQMEVTNRNWGVLAVLVGGNKLEIIDRERDREVGAMILKRIREFWALVEAGTPPGPDFAKDCDAIRKLFRDADTGREPIDLRGDQAMRSLCQRYKEAGDRKKSAESEQKAASAEILMTIGDAPGAFLDDFKISAKTVAASTYEVSRDAYRNLRITAAKA